MSLPMIIYSKFLVPKGFLGITLFPFVFLRSKQLKTNVTLVNHELIHLRQQLELLVLPFYIWYGLEYVLRFLKYRNHQEAYRNICFEREAYSKENDLEYLKTRSFWRFLKFL